MFNKNKFSIPELFNDKNGKTSGSAYLGVFLGTIAGLSFIAGTFGWFLKMPFVMEYIGQVIALCAIASLLMGVRKVTEVFKKDTSDKVTNVNDV